MLYDCENHHDKEAGIIDPLKRGVKVVGREVTSVLPTILGAAAGGAGFLGGAAMGWGRIPTMMTAGVSGNYGAQIGMALKNRLSKYFTNRPSMPAAGMQYRQGPVPFAADPRAASLYGLGMMPPGSYAGQGNEGSQMPGPTRGRSGAYPQYPAKIAATRGPAYHAGLKAGQGAIEFAMRNHFGKRDAKRLLKSMIRSGANRPGQHDWRPEERSFAEGVRSTKPYLKGFKALDRFRGAGFDDVSFVAQGDPGKPSKYYFMEGKGPHFATGRPSMFGMSIDLMREPSNAGAKTAEMVDLFLGKTAEAPRTQMRQLTAQRSLRRRLEDHATEHALMRSMGIGRRNTAESLARLLSKQY